MKVAALTIALLLLANGVNAEPQKVEVDIDLGEQSKLGAPEGQPPSSSPAKSAQSARPWTGGSTAAATQAERLSPVKAEAPRSTAEADVERVEYKGRPVRTVLAVGRERMITFQNPVRLHIPKGYEAYVRVEAIDRAVFVTALEPFGAMRVIAEEVDGERRRFPLDLTAESGTAATSELQIKAPVKEQQKSAGGDAAPVDAVALTRYAAKMIYAPRRLAPTTPGVVQIPVTRLPAAGLYRGARLQAVPIGAWRSGDLYVTAVKVTNLGDQVIELDLDEIRGRWLTATAQHLRLERAGSEADTTAIYLVCDQPFEACR